MKIALYQMNIIWEDKEKNYKNLEEQLYRLYEKNVELFLLPEMSFTGFSMNVDVTKESKNETVNRMIEFAKKYNVAIGFGWVKDCGEKSENHYTIVNKAGEVISDYAKIHPFSFSGENQKFRGGERTVTFKLGDMIFSTFICYDLRFPEIFQAVSKDAHVIIIPADWPEKRSEHWKCLLRARAIENQVYIAAVNCVGEIGGLIYSGDSCIIDPEGKVLVQSSGAEGVLEYELINNLNVYRNAFPVKNDRREDLYYAMNNRS